MEKGSGPVSQAQTSEPGNPIVRKIPPISSVCDVGIPVRRTSNKYPILVNPARAHTRRYGPLLINNFVIAPVH